jgi:hypothetical protein
MNTAQAFLDESFEERRIRREHGNTHGYEFVVACSIDPDAPGGSAARGVATCTT